MTEQPVVQLQLEPGLFGVIKLRWRDWPVRNVLSFVLAGVFVVCAIVLILLSRDAPSDPPTWYKVASFAVAALFVAIVALRLVLEGTVSKPPPGSPPKHDRQIIDPWWTTVHTLAGVTFGVWFVPFLVTVLITTAWEVFEISVPGFGDEEITGNRLTDLLFAWAGWLLAQVILCVALDTSLVWI